METVVGAKESPALLRFLPMGIVLSIWSLHFLIERRFDYFKYGVERALTELEGQHLAYEDHTERAGFDISPGSFLNELPAGKGILNYRNFVPLTIPVAVSDLDGDGFEDVILADGFGPEPMVAYRNRRDGTFERFPRESNLLVAEVGMVGAVLVIDFDNDGHRDVIYNFNDLFGLNELRLLRNLGGGKFADASHLIAERKLFSLVTSIRAIDANRDGYPDIYVSALFRNVIKVDSKTGVAQAGYFQPIASKRDTSFAGPNYFFRNHRGKHLEMVPLAGGAGNFQLAWDASVIDLNGDGYQDLVVANDFSIVRTFENDRRGNFYHSTRYRIPTQYATSNMGINVADLDGDAEFDIFVTNAVRSTFMTSNTNHALVRREGKAFQNQFQELGLGRCGFAWGSQVADLDLDGHDEVLVANGYFNDGDKEYAYHFHTYSSLPPFLVGDPTVLPNSRGYRFATDERNCLFKKTLPEGPYTDVALSAGVRDLSDGRGIALIDPLNEGRYSILISNNNEPMHFYRNVSSRQHNWVGVRLAGRASGRDAFGAIVQLRAGTHTQRKYFNPAQGFSSQTSAQLLFGLGSLPAGAVEFEVTWPSGRVTKHSKLQMNRYHLLQEGVP